MERNGQQFAEIQDPYALQQTLLAEGICVNACGPLTVTDERVLSQHTAKAPGIPHTLITSTRKDMRCDACGYDHTSIKVTADEDIR